MIALKAIILYQKFFGAFFQKSTACFLNCFCLGSGH